MKSGLKNWGVKTLKFLPPTLIGLLAPMRSQHQHWLEFGQNPSCDTIFRSQK